MEELKYLVISAQNGDLDAFGVIVERFYDMARSCARSILTDADSAEDAVQEAFVNAYRAIGSLREPEAFPGWFRGVVINSARRFIRGKQLPTITLDELADIPSDAPGPAETLERSEMRQRVVEAMTSLPEHERTVTQLFYLGGYSQQDIATHLTVPLTTVNSRLHSSRRRLRRVMADMAPESQIEHYSRSKRGRGLLPPRFTEAQKERLMALTYDRTRRKLMQGDKEILIRVMTREDIPAMRKLDDEITGDMDAWNAGRPPGGESQPGGPWSEDAWLTAHFEKFEKSGNIILVVEDEQSGRLVAFADLWVGHEPEPFGNSLDLECVDYLREYYHMGVEIALLEEAEKVARAAGLEAVDIGTNTASGDYPSLRSFGMRVFYECDWIWCRCQPVAADKELQYRHFELPELDLNGLVTVGHWCPTGFTHRTDDERGWFAEFEVMGHRVVLELFGPEDPATDRNLPVPEYAPESGDLFISPEVLKSPEAMSEILRASALLAGKAGAEQVKLSCPSDMKLDSSKVDVIRREFAFAWMRKSL